MPQRDRDSYVKYENSCHDTYEKRGDKAWATAKNDSSQGFMYKVAKDNYKKASDCADKAANPEKYGH
jgi:hypothetical protein